MRFSKLLFNRKINKGDFLSYYINRKRYYIGSLSNKEIIWVKELYPVIVINLS